MEAHDYKERAVQARKFYNEKLKQTLESTDKGKFVAIEVDSGSYFLGSTPLEAIKYGKKTFPHKMFHVMKVGYKAAILLKGRRALPWKVL